MIECAKGAKSGLPVTCTFRVGKGMLLGPVILGCPCGRPCRVYGLVKPSPHMGAGRFSRVGDRSQGRRGWPGPGDLVHQGCILSCQALVE